MHPRIAEIVKYLISARAHLDAAVDSVPVARRDERPGPDRWSVANVLQHLAMTESGIAKLIERRTADARAAGIGPDPETTTILWTLDVHRLLDRRTRLETPTPIPPGQEVAAEEAARIFDAAHQRLAAAVAAADGVALGSLLFPHPLLGPINLYQWGIFAAAHEMRHAAQIREIGAQVTGASA